MKFQVLRLFVDSIWVAEQDEMENPVLFGVLDVEVQQQQGLYDNVCFGKAFWLAESPSQEQLKCGICGDVCFLIVQSKN